MPVVDVVCPDGRTEQVVDEEGVTVIAEVTKHFIPGRSLRDQIEMSKVLPIRDDDVFIATYPKAGTHWVWEIVSMLLKGEAEYEVKSKDSAMLEFLTKEQAESMPSPRVLNSHYPVHLIPQEMMTKKTKIIHVIRNPKDVMVSRYNHIKNMTKMYQSPLNDSFSTSLQFFIGEFGPYDYYPYHKYVLEWERFTDAHPDHVLTLYFEDMKEDIVREIKKLVAFLNTGADDKLVNAIALACEFENLKRADEQIKEADFEKMLSSSGQSMMFRKGEVGDWKNWFTVADNERFDHWISEHLVDTKLRIRYQL